MVGLDDADGLAAAAALEEARATVVQLKKDAAPKEDVTAAVAELLRLKELCGEKKSTPYPAAGPAHLAGMVQLPSTCAVVWVDDLDGVLAAQEHLSRAEMVGMDCEWRPGTSKVALLQLATSAAVFLIDMLALDDSAVLALLTSVFDNPLVLKLGFRFEQDLRMLQGWWLGSTAVSAGAAIAPWAEGSVKDGSVKEDGNDDDDSLVPAPLRTISPFLDVSDLMPGAASNQIGLSRLCRTLGLPQVVLLAPAGIICPGHTARGRRSNPWRFTLPVAPALNFINDSALGLRKITLRFRRTATRRHGWLCLARRLALLGASFGVGWLARDLPVAKA